MLMLMCQRSFFSLQRTLPGLPVVSWMNQFHSSEPGSLRCRQSCGKAVMILISGTICGQTVKNSIFIHTNLLINFRKAQWWEKCLWFVLMKQLLGRSVDKWMFLKVSALDWYSLRLDFILHPSHVKRLERKAAHLRSLILYRHLQAVRLHCSGSPSASVTVAWGCDPPGQPNTLGSHGDDAMKTPQRTDRQCAFLLSLFLTGTMGHSGE